jgi:signal peptidase
MCKKIITVIEAVALVAFFGLAAFVGLNLNNGNWQLTPVLSGSMRPGLSVGGVAISERVPLTKLADRDVIVFQDPIIPTEEVVHRIVELRKTGSSFLINTQGDANNVRDPWTMTIKGKDAYEVRWSVPLVGYAAVWFQNDRGLLLSGAGVVLCVIAGSVALGTRKRGLHVKHHTVAPVP